MAHVGGVRVTAVAIETSVLESLDFEIGCQTTRISFITREVVETCSKTATHTARIHTLTGCQWIEKFLCDEHAADYNHSCWDCDTSPRIKDCVPLGAPS